MSAEVRRFMEAYNLGRAWALIHMGEPDKREAMRELHHLPWVEPVELALVTGWKTLKDTIGVDASEGDVCAFVDGAVHIVDKFHTDGCSRATV
jgi:hypothetical protein